MIFTKSSLGTGIGNHARIAAWHKLHFSLGFRFQGGLSLVHTMVVVVSDGVRMFQAVCQLRIKIHADSLANLQLYTLKPKRVFSGALSVLAFGGVR